MRVTCDRGNHLLLEGGTKAGLTLTANPQLDVAPTITFPVRRGDRRVIQLSSWWKWQTPLAVLSEAWPAADARPIIAFDAVYSPGIAVLP